MIPHEKALVIVRTKPRPGAKRWVRPVVLERIRAKQAANVHAMHQVHRAAQRYDAADTITQLIESAG